MDATGSDQKVRFCRRTVLELRDYALALLLYACKLVTDMQMPLRQRIGQKADKIGAVEVVVWRAEGRLDLEPERCALQGASVVPPPLMDCTRSHPDSIHRRFEAGAAARVGTRWG
jgi:hypothetical protein